MSKIGVPSIRSAPPTWRTVPESFVCSTPRSRTQDKPRLFGRKGDRVANTPILLFPPSRGGRTVGLQSVRTASENCQIIQRWEKPSMPRRASGSRNSGVNTMVERSCSTSPLCRGMPNLVEKSLRIWAMGRIVTYILTPRLSETEGHRKNSSEAQADGGTGGASGIIGH